MTVWWKIGFTLCGLTSASDAIMALATFHHAGDMHLSWASDAIIAAGTFFYVGWKS